MLFLNKCANEIEKEIKWNQIFEMCLFILNKNTTFLKSKQKQKTHLIIT